MKYSCLWLWFVTIFLVDIPGLLEAARGYDTPMGNPHPSKGFMDPGDEKSIFCYSVWGGDFPVMFLEC